MAKSMRAHTAPLAFVCFMLLAPCNAQPTTGSLLTRFAASPAITLECAGHSREGRQIPLVIAASPEARRRGVPRVLIICRQHGDEPLTTRAGLRLIQRLARAESARQPSDLSTEVILSHLVTLILPLTNPDGAAAETRENATGTDLNRDWPSPSQAETQAIRTILRRWRPSLVIDVHEWATNDKYQVNTLELPFPASVEPSGRQRLDHWTNKALLACLHAGITIHRTYWGSDCDPRLAHRAIFTHYGIPALLFEMRPVGTAPDAERLRAASLFLWTLLTVAAVDIPTAPPPDPSPEPAPPAHSFPWIPLLYAGGLLLLAYRFRCGAAPLVQQHHSSYCRRVAHNTGSQQHRVSGYSSGKAGKIPPRAAAE